MKEITLEYEDKTKNYWRFKLDKDSWIATVYVPKSLYEEKPKSVKVVIE